MSCDICHGSGEVGQSGMLDCQEPGCTAAAERKNMNAYLLALGPLAETDLVWAAYRLGKAKAHERISVLDALASQKGPPVKYGRFIADADGKHVFQHDPDLALGREEQQRLNKLHNER